MTNLDINQFNPQKVKLQLCTYTDDDYRQSQFLLRDNEVVWQSADLFETPEDATLSRNMTSGYEIISLLQMFEGKKIVVLPEKELTEEEYKNM